MRQDLVDIPARDGVGASCVALPPGDWPGVLGFLAARFPAISHGEWTDRMLRGAVLDGKGAALAPGAPYKPGERVYYWRHLPDEPRIPFDEQVLFRDEELLVADKPHFLPVTPAGRYLQETLLVRLKRSTGIETLVPVHRIDRETAGLVLFAIQPASRDRYAAMFRERAVAKQYEAVAPWHDGLEFPMVLRTRLVEGASFMTMREEAGEPNCETRLDVLERLGEVGARGLARYRLEPHTGRRHQLRAQMAALGLPIVGDAMYPTLLPQAGAGEQADYGKPLQLLARALSFADPVTGQLRHFESRRKLAF